MKRIAQPANRLKQHVSVKRPRSRRVEKQTYNTGNEKRGRDGHDCEL
jgi:hypothetical protein